MVRTRPADPRAGLVQEAVTLCLCREGPRVRRFGLRSAEFSRALSTFLYDVKHLFP